MSFIFFSFPFSLSLRVSLFGEKNSHRCFSGEALETFEKVALFRRPEAPVAPEAKKGLQKRPF